MWLDVVRVVSIILLWLCIWLNVATLILNFRAFRKWRRLYDELSLEYFDNLFKKFESDLTNREE